MSEVDLLKEQIRQLTNENASLKSGIEQFKTTLNLSLKYTSKSNLIIQRLVCCLSFLKFLDDKSCIFGSFIRNFFEFTLNNSEIGLAHTNTGDVTKNNVRILLTSDNPKNRQNVTIRFNEIINKLNYILDQNRQSPNCSKPSFVNYQYVGISDMTDLIDFNGHIIPRKTLVMSNIFDTFNIEFIAWKPSLAYTLPLDLVAFNTRGFFVLTSLDTWFASELNLVSIFEQIINKQVTITQPLIRLQDVAFPQDKSPVTRNTKVNYLMKMFNIIKSSYLPFMECSYTFSGAVPKIIIEKIEDCPITGCSAPYPVFILKCGHSISLMGYKGLICKGDTEFSEAIKCPMCRKDLTIAFENIIKNTFSYDKRLDTLEINSTKLFNQMLLSEDAQKHI
jgi:hypothetical protein